MLKTKPLISNVRLYNWKRKLIRTQKRASWIKVIKVSKLKTLYPKKQVQYHNRPI